MRDDRAEPQAPLFITAHVGDEVNSGEDEKTLSQTRRKQRHRYARLPVWRGRGSTERGAPV
jgi:hypothetical protein